MNNLLQSLSSQRLRVHVPDADLKRLLSAVKDGRGHDAKLSDAFYDSLEGILLELRTVTIDNHDAEAFLKPVSKTDYPDYYEIIKEPMDLQTMIRKVKQKQYKSKIEFQDDLELIWSNCFVYNTGDNHPLRMCAKRLQQKANRLLKNITDRRDRLDPPIPSPVDVRPNGVMVNGHSRKHSATPIPKMPIVIKKSVPSRTASIAPPSPPPPRREHTFADQPAFLRSAAGMSTFATLDRELDLLDASLEPENVAGPSRLPITEKLRQIVPSEGDSDEDEELGMEVVNGDVGYKRKLAANGDIRPRKRARTRTRPANSEPVDLWWEATTSNALMVNALPTLTYSHSAVREPILPFPLRNRIRKKKKKRPPEQQPPPKSLLGLINTNIRTLRRMRQIHDKFLNLNLGAEEGSTSGPSMAIDPPDPGPMADDPEKVGEVLVDDRPWRTRGTGLDIGEQDATDCLRWMGTKVLEHSGFQSTSKSALNVFTGVATEYLFNVGRTLRYLCDKYSQQMSSEEIILHTLFESGITHIRDLERYITDDVIRYGTRLTDLEKKLTNAYTEVTVDTALDDEAFFNEDEEEDGELLMGNFADSFGDDFLGLRELGIASELGLQSLTIPKKLLKGKNKQRNAQAGMKPSEPPPPYPPPSPFTPIDSTRIDGQIGLLRNFYIQRINTHAARTMPTQPPPFVAPPASGPSQLEIELAREMGTEPPVVQAPPPIRNLAAPTVVLPDDAPPATRTRSGPLGQIMRPSANSGLSKKKPKAGTKDSVLGPAGPGPGIPPPTQRPMQPMTNGPPPVSNTSTEGYAVLPGSSGLSAGMSAGDGGKKNASPKKKTEQPQNQMPSFVAANA